MQHKYLQNKTIIFQVSLHVKTQVRQNLRAIKKLLNGTRFYFYPYSLSSRRKNKINRVGKTHEDSFLSNDTRKITTEI